MLAATLMDDTSAASLLLAGCCETLFVLVFLLLPLLLVCYVSDMAAISLPLVCFVLVFLIGLVFLL